MKKLAKANLLALWFFLALALVHFAAPAQAYVYDDFNGTEINSSLWVDTVSEYSLFSQHDGSLYFNDPAPGHRYDGLRSTSRWNTPFFVSMQYADFQAVNNTTGDFQGSGPVLWIGDGNKSVSVYEYINSSSSGIPQGFRAIVVEGSSKTGLTYTISTSASDAILGINYDGIYVTFWFDAGSGWQEIPLFAPYAPGFASKPFFGIKGQNQYGESMSFRVEQVQFVPTPLPPSLLLLGSGLLGLAGLGRRRKRN